MAIGYQRVLKIWPAIGEIGSSAALASGAYVSGAAIICDGFDNATLYVEYTRGGAAGEQDFRVMFSPSETGGDWFQEILLEPGALTPGTVADDLVQEKRNRYVPLAAGLQSFEYEIENLRANRIRVDAREIGDGVDPGTARILLMLGHGGKATKR